MTIGYHLHVRNALVGLDPGGCGPARRRRSSFGAGERIDLSNIIRYFVRIPAMSTEVRNPMTLDPRTPVLVGGGQINNRDGGIEPVDLIAAAARRAAEESTGRGVVEAIDSIRLVRMLSWKYRDPGLLVGERLGADVRHTAYTGDGGNSPQTLVAQAAADIASGRAEVVLVGGAESWRTRMKLRAAGERPGWTVQDDAVPAAELAVPNVPMVFDGQKRIGLDRPAYVYPLFEQALRLSAGRSVTDHRDHVGGIWSRFSEIAAQNPYAWTQRAYTPEEIADPGPDNRWISWPYTKLMNSNNMVEQGAAVILCSVEAAGRLGIPRDKWVFPQAAVDAHDTYDIAERGRFDASPAIRVAGARVLEHSGLRIEEVDLVDIYSCFPSAVQIAADELGVAVDDPDRALTVTGGLTFAGGPWNNYSTHAIATMATRLRENPGSVGMVTANGGYLTKHSIAIYATEPPAVAFRHDDVQAEVDAQPTVPALQEYEGTGTVESWTVVYGRDGTPERGLLAVREPGGARTMAGTSDEAHLAALTTSEIGGAKVVVGADGDLRDLS